MVRTNKHKTFTQETAVHVQCEIKSTVSYPKKKKKTEGTTCTAVLLKISIIQHTPGCN